MQFKVYCKYVDYANTLDIFLFEEEGSGRRTVCTNLDPLTFSEYKQRDKIKPVLSLNGQIVKPFLQAIANELKTIDILPEGSPVPENELVATKYHLEDMRDLVFKDKK